MADTSQKGIPDKRGLAKTDLYGLYLDLFRLPKCCHIQDVQSMPLRRSSSGPRHCPVGSTPSPATPAHDSKASRGVASREAKAVGRRRERAGGKISERPSGNRQKKSVGAPGARCPLCRSSSPKGRGKLPFSAVRLAVQNHRGQLTQSCFCDLLNLVRAATPDSPPQFSRTHPAHVPSRTSTLKTWLTLLAASDGRGRGATPPTLRI